jgi:hypothetical protein
MSWSTDGSHLYFVVTEGSGKQAILSIDPSRDPAQVLSRAKGRESFADLHPSEDGRSLCYVRSDGFPKTVSTLSCLDLGTGLERRLYSETHDGRRDLIFRGFLDSGRSLLVLSATFLEDWTERLRVLRVTDTGTPVLVGKVDRGFGGTARLDSKAKFLYLTKADVETGVHNLWEFRLSDGRLRPLTDNPSAQVSFSGLEVLDDGRLVYSEQERDSEFRLITFQP